MPTFNLAKTTSAWSPDISSYKMTVEITGAVDAPSEIFVIKRTRDFVKDQFDDVFAAIATPTQLEDFPINAPTENSSYYRTNKATLIVRTAEGMQAVFDSMLYEIKKLATDLESINNGLSSTKTYEISGDTSVFSGATTNPPGQTTSSTGAPARHAASHNINGTDPITITAAQVTGLSAVATSGSYDDLTNKPAGANGQVQSDWTAVSGLGQILNKPTLFSGAYADLSNKPTLFSGAYADLSNKPTLFSGSYTDLTSKPTLFSGSYTDLTSKPTLFSGSYADLSNKPTLGTAATADIATSGNASSTQVVKGNDARLTDSRAPLSHAASHASGGTDVLTLSASQLTGTISDSLLSNNIPRLVSGLIPSSNLPSYVDDVLEYPTYVGLPETGEIGKIYVVTTTNIVYRWSGSSYVEISPSTGQVQSDWTAVSGLGQILNKPTLFSGSYTDLTSKPTLGTSSTKDIPASGNASSTQVVYGSDTRLSDSRTPSSTLAHAASHARGGTDPLSLAASQITGLASIATSGSYDDLSNKPTLFSGSYTDLTSKPTLFSGSYTDLTSKPTLGTSSTKDIPASGNASSTQVVYGSDTRLSDSRTPSSTLAHASSHSSGGTDPLSLAASQITGLASIATSGSYDDLSNKPTLFSGSYTDLTSKPTLGTSSTKDIPASGNASSTQVVYGSDTRLSDSRTPSTHASSHSSGGTDPLSLAASQITGLASIATSGSAGDLSTGTLNDSRLSTNVLLLTGSQTITGTKTITPAAGSSALIASNVTHTTSAPILDLTQTWNASGVTFSALKLSVTNTASTTASTLLDLSVGGTSQLQVTPAKQIRLFNARVDASNYEAGVLDWTTNSNALTIGTQKAGSGTARRVRINSAENIDFYITDSTRVLSLATNGNTSQNSLNWQYYSGAGAPTTATTPWNNGAGTCAVWRDSTAGTVRLYVNNAGTMVSVALT